MSNEKKAAPFCTQTILTRIHKVTGQSLGIERMVKSGRQVESILLQISAIKSALTGLAQELLTMHLEQNIKNVAENKDSSDEAIDNVAAAVQYFCRMK
ncbi:MAG: metal-sensitive transcriptional regulator [Kiritimatiellae bacterium]|jgi:DNA-binding FrmR family transcriptional regulator|nr:metal-sensitive transcriptional regulator [Kiritimatiellia bacterium]